MVFKTHELPVQYRATGLGRIGLEICGMLVTIYLIAATIILTIELHSIVKSFLCQLPILLILIVWGIRHNDMKKAFVEITDDKITVVDYYCFIKCQKTFYLSDIDSAKVTYYSRGYKRMRGRLNTFHYIVFRGIKNKYLFKVIYSEEIKAYFEKLFTIENA